MRFTLQHILIWQACCLVLIAINWAIGGRCDVWQGSITLLVCGAGCVWGIWRHRKKKNLDIAIAPLASVVKGIMVAVLFSLVMGFIFGNQLYEVCTRTHAQRITRNLGVLNPTQIFYGTEAAYIRDQLKFVPNEHHWVTTTYYSSMMIGDAFPDITIQHWRWN